jgi:AraC family transcriptional regulator
MTPGTFARFLAPDGPAPTDAGHGVKLVSRFAAPACGIETPPLTHHVVALHLGSDAPVTRGLAGRVVRRSLRRGAVTIVPALERTSWLLEGPDEFLHLYLPPVLLRQAWDETGAGAADAGPDLRAPFGGNDSLVEQILLALLDAGGAADPFAGLYANSVVHALTLHLIRAHAGAGPGRHRPPRALPTPALALVLDYVEVNLDRPMALADLAAVAGLSVFHFARVFRRSVGQTQHRYVKQRRVDAARRRLAAGTREPIIEVAAACGFASPSHFASAFRRLAGVSPREYRRRASL